MLRRVAISAGEPSGDEHAAALLGELRRLAPAAAIRGMGGRFLRAAEVEIVVDAEETGSVMGFGPVFGALRRIFSAYSSMKKLLREWKPEVLILVDYPDFNLRLARYAKSLGIRVFYFIPPKMWAWRSGRIEQFKKYVDAVGLIFPFEKEFFMAHGYPNAFFVGHPYVESLKPSPEIRKQFFAEYKLNEKSPLLAVLPGSRWFEIERHLDIAIEVVRQLRAKLPELQTAIAVAPTIDATQLQARLPSELEVTIVRGGALKLMQAATAGLLKSGTSNLQAAFLKLPAVMFYTAPRLTKWIVDTFVRIKEYSLPNIIRPHTIAEFTGSTLTASGIAESLLPLLAASDTRSAVLCGYGEVVAKLSSYDPIPQISEAHGAYARAAALVVRGFDPTSK